MVFVQYEPLKKENERIIKENNDLHLKVIQLKEDCEQREASLKAKAKQAVAERADLQFLSQQKEIKIQTLDRVVAEMQAKLEKALAKVFSPAANDIVKGLKKEINQQENIIARKQEMTLSKGLIGSSSQDGQNMDPNRGSAGDIHQSQANHS